MTNALPRRVGSVSRHATLTAVVLSVAAGGLSAQSLPFVDFGSIRPDSQGPHEVVDIDGDGDLDLLRAYSSGFSSASVELLVNDGRGSFSAAGAPLPVGYRVTAMACEDFDGDGRQDLAVASYPRAAGPSDVRLFLQTAPAVFAPPVVIAGSGMRLDALSVGDVDGDGDTDVVVGVLGGQTKLLLNTGTGQFVDATVTSMPVDADLTCVLEMGDLDGDGDLDLVLGNGVGAGPYQSQYTYQPARLYLNDGSGVFLDQSSQLGSLPRPTSGLALGDLDGDGDLDCVAAAGYVHDSAQGRIEFLNELFLNDGTGQFTRSTWGANLSAGDVVLGDMDGDGDLDVLQQDAGRYPTQGRGVSVLLNDGFGLLASVNIGVTVRGIVGQGDLDGDGDLDAVLWGAGSPAAFGTSVLTNLLTQADIGSPPRVGQTVNLDLYSGFGAAIALPYLSPASAAISAGPLGVLGIDPTQAVGLPWVSLSAAAGMATVSFTIPNDPALAGLPVFAQSLFLQGPLGDRLSNVAFDVIR